MGARITILKAKAIEQDSGSVPGRIEKVGENELHISTGKGILSVLEVKPEGRKSMSATDFARGRHLREGMSFDAS
jgi:methionyl-tRNA formyltransferase